MKNLETQVGQLALTMQNHSNNVFLRDTRKNPKDCMVVTLRSGRKRERSNEENKKNTETVEGEETGTENKYSSSVEVEKTGKEEVQNEQQEEREELKKKEDKNVYMPAVPFPRRLQKAKIEEQLSRFLDVFKKIEINIPFVEALTWMPNYAKFLKDILSKKRNFVEK